MTAPLRKIATVSGPSGVAHVYRNVEWNEYEVRLVGAPRAASYHTDDKQDAMDTASAMVTPR